MRKEGPGQRADPSRLIQLSQFMLLVLVYGYSVNTAYCQSFLAIQSNEQTARLGVLAFRGTKSAQARW